MEKKLIYDLPTRIFHWSFAGLFLTAFVIAKTVDDESPTYAYHMLAGLSLGFIVILRIVWGFVGTKHARFSGFELNPMSLVQYLKGILSGDKTKWAGHNPASSWAAVVMIVFALGLGLTGYLMTSSDNKETYEDIHELLANGFIIVALLHVAGIIVHTIRHQEIIGLSMVTGKKNNISLEQQIHTSKNGVAILFVALIVSFGVRLYQNYDSQTQQLQFFGSTLQLGENEEGEDEDRQMEGENQDENEDDESGDDD